MHAAMVTLDNLGFIANMVSLVMYFMIVLHFDLSGSSNTLTNFMGSTFMVTVLGGFISDTYLTRLNTVLLFGVFEIVVYMLISWLIPNIISKLIYKSELYIYIYICCG